MIRFVYNNAWALGPDIKHLTEQVEKLLVGRNVLTPSSHFLMLIKFLMTLLCRSFTSLRKVPLPTFLHS